MISHFEKILLLSSSLFNSVVVGMTFMQVDTIENRLRDAEMRARQAEKRAVIMKDMPRYNTCFKLMFKEAHGDGPISPAAKDCLASMDSFVKLVDSYQERFENRMKMPEDEEIALVKPTEFYHLRRLINGK